MKMFSNCWISRNSHQHLPLNMVNVGSNFGRSYGMCFVVGLSLLLLLSASARLSAATYYVSTAGSDSNPGSQSQPWRTVQKAANTTVAGDTVNIATGTYAENVTISASGSSASPITFNGPGAVSSFVVRGAYIVLTNLTINGSGAPAVQWSGNNGYVTTCTINGATTRGFNVDAANCTFTNLNFYGLAAACVPMAMGDDCDTILIVNCLFHDTDNDDAFFFVWGKNITIRGNTMTNCQNSGYTSLGIHADFIQTFAFSSSAMSSNVVIEQNKILNSNVQCFMLNAANTGITQSPNIRNWEIRNNIFAGSVQSGFIDMPYVNVYNNIFYKWGTANAFAFQIGSAAYPSAWANGDNVTIRNNIFLACNASEAATWGWFSKAYGTNTIADHNYFGGINYAAKSVSETGMVNGVNPRFVNESAYDFHLQTNSPLKDAGVAIASFNSDKDGVSRPQGSAWDIGPYEMSSSSSSSPNPVILVSPSSLDFGTVLTNTGANLTLTVQNTGGGTLTGVASVSSPFQIVSGGTYNLGSNQTQTVTVRFNPTAAGTFNQPISFNGGNGAGATLGGLAYVMQPSLSFGSSAGSILAPFTVASVGSLVGTSSYISQAVTTGLSASGEAIYGFNITTAGNYLISVQVNTPSTSANSFFINIDSQPTDPTMIWDVPVTSGFTNQFVSWRGTGTDTNSEFAPKVFNLSAGTHQLIVRGRESGAQLASITILQMPPAPQNVRIISP